MIAQADSWRREPFGAVEAIPYAAAFTPAEFARVERGLVPGEMEDKWFIYVEEPSLFLHRSWTGQAVFRVDFKRVGNEVRTSHALCSANLVANGSHAEQARLLSFLISNLLLGRAEPFPMPAGVTEPAPGIYQHMVAGTGYPESAPQQRRRRPWWKFWRG